MSFLSAAYTDIGNVRKVNQDAFCLKTATTSSGPICLVVLCDGMGGLQNGELASSFIVNAFSRWFKEELPRSVKKGLDIADVKKQWEDLIQSQHKKIVEYGQKNGNMGTTVSALLLWGDNSLTLQVGDSRIYKLGTKLRQITKDQSFVAQEVESGRLTAKQARTHPRRNEILQAVGVSNPLRPVLTQGKTQVGEVFLLCSDGFYHELTDEELFGLFAPVVMASEAAMKDSVREVTELVKTRGEVDNITAVLVKRNG